MASLKSLHWTSDWQSLTAGKGAYIICIDLKTRIPAPPRFEAFLNPGIYFYAGSANGPGGIQARCRRHLRQDKKPHWHIDWLTNHAKEMRILAFPNGSECALMERLISEPNTRIILPGFGSSDCSQCASHLALCPSSHDKQDHMLRHSQLFLAGPFECP